MEVEKDLLLIIKSTGLGEGEPDMGEKLMGAFLGTLLESERIPDQIIFMNAGAFLTTEGSAHIGLLKEFEHNGARISTCGTCLDYYGRKDKLLAGSAGTMKETVAAMLGHSKIISP